jgi:hypothetical protein
MTPARMPDLPLPPEGFDPVTASNAELQRFGYPRRPDSDASPQAFEHWRDIYSRPLWRANPRLTRRAARLQHRTQHRRLRVEAGEDLWAGGSYGALYDGPVAKPIINVHAQWTIPEVRNPGAAPAQVPTQQPVPPNVDIQLNRGQQFYDPARPSWLDGWVPEFPWWCTLATWVGIGGGPQGDETLVQAGIIQLFQPTDSDANIPMEWGEYVTPWILETYAFVEWPVPYSPYAVPDGRQIAAVPVRPGDEVSVGIELQNLKRGGPANEWLWSEALAKFVNLTTKVTTKVPFSMAEAAETAAEAGYRGPPIQACRGEAALWIAENPTLAGIGEVPMLHFNTVTFNQCGGAVAKDIFPSGPRGPKGPVVVEEPFESGAANPLLMRAATMRDANGDVMAEADIQPPNSVEVEFIASE